MADDLADDEQATGYVAPKKVTLDEMKNKDANDESLNRWKQSLGLDKAAKAGGDPRKVIVKKMRFVPEGARPIELDLTGDLTTLKDTAIVIKENAVYHLEIVFKVQNEVVSGLKYVHAVYRMGVKVAKDSHMLGSYGPKDEDQVAKTRKEEAPSGMMARGHYTVKSRFVDDDNDIHLEWEWSFDIKKEWSS